MDCHISVLLIQKKRKSVLHLMQFLYPLTFRGLLMYKRGGIFYAVYTTVKKRPEQTSHLLKKEKNKEFFFKGDNKVTYDNSRQYAR